MIRGLIPGRAVESWASKSGCESVLEGTMRQPRRTELRRRRTRHRTLVKLRRRFETAESSSEKAAVLVKLSKVVPWVVEDWRQWLERASPVQEEVVGRKSTAAPGEAGRPGRRAAAEVGRPETAPRADLSNIPTPRGV